MRKNWLSVLKRIRYLLLAVLLAAAIYGWSLWYYGGLYRMGTLLSVSSVTEKNLGRMFLQHLITAVPELVILSGAVLFQQRDFPQIFGLQIKKRGGRIAVCLAGSVYLLLLAAGLIWSGVSPLSVLYQWGYYLLFVALAEELVFRGLLPWLVGRGGLPEWCVWVIPGLLFGCMHTLIPVIEKGVTMELAEFFAASIMGYLVGACGFYALRRWSGTLWLPVLLHASLDFSSIFAM